MAGQENLIPFNELTEEEQREIASKGGKASVEARRKKKAMREVAEMVLGSRISDKDKKIIHMLQEKGISEEDMTYQTAVVFATLGQALKGNVKAVKELRAMTGEDIQKVEINAPIDKKVEELKEILDDI